MLTNEQIREIGKPRRLTATEIDNIVGVIDEPPAVDVNNRRVIMEAIRKYEREQLSLYKVTPFAIDDLKQIIYKRYKSSIYFPGEALGMITANAIGQPLMQLVLDAFHVSGSSSNVAVGYAAAKETLTATEKISNPSTTIRFKDIINLDTSLDFREKYVNITVESLVKLDLLASPRDILGESYPWWYQNFELFFGIVPFNTPYMLRLVLNVVKMAKHNITPLDVLNAVQNNEFQRNDTIKAIISPIIKESHTDDNGKPFPMTMCYLDIYPVKDKVLSISELNIGEQTSPDQILMFFLSKNVYNNLNKVKIKGMDNVMDIFPVEMMIYAIVYSIYDMDNKQWLIEFNQEVMWKTGITPFQLKELLKYMKIEIVDDTRYDSSMFMMTKVTYKPDNYDAIMETPADQVVDNLSPKQIYNYYLKFDRDNKRDYENEQRRKNIEEGKNELILRPSSDFENVAVTYYVNTLGNDLRETFRIPEVDPYHTYSNNMHEILAMLGIEATRTYLVDILNKIFTNSDQYIDPHHILLIADVMTHQGVIIKYTFVGSAPLNAGPLARAAFQRAQPTLTAAAAMGTFERTSDVISVSTFIGQIPNYGTVMYPEQISAEKRQEYERKYGKPSKPVVGGPKPSVTDVMSSLSQLNNDEFTEDVVVNPSFPDGDGLIDDNNPHSKTDDFQSTLMALRRDAGDIREMVNTSTIGGLQSLDEPNLSLFPSPTVSNAVVAAAQTNMANTDIAPEFNINALRTGVARPGQIPDLLPVDSKPEVKPAVTWADASSVQPILPDQAMFIGENEFVDNLLREGATIDISQYHV